MDAEDHGILVADIEPRRRAAVTGVLRKAGWRTVVEAADGNEAGRLTKDLSPAVAVVGLPHTDYQEAILLCRDLLATHTPPLLILYGRYTGTGKEELTYLLSGAHGFAILDPDHLPGWNNSDSLDALVTVTHRVASGETVTDQLHALNDVEQALAESLANE